jgi:hypothetical protein
MQITHSVVTKLSWYTLMVPLEATRHVGHRVSMAVQEDEVEDVTSDAEQDGGDVLDTAKLQLYIMNKLFLMLLSRLINWFFVKVGLQ